MIINNIYKQIYNKGIPISIVLNVVLLCIVSWTCYGQYDDFAPPSPNTAELMRYVEAPVNKYTGVPNISIPIYTIEYGEARVPISVSYHAGGIKVAQEASWVGLGWNLNAGGCISREIQGFDDFNEQHGWAYGDSKDVMPTDPADPNAFSTFVQHNSISSAGYHLERKEADGESDIYSFNFLGYSGKFILDKYGNPHILEQTGDLAIINTPGQSCGEWRCDNWQIRSNTGIIFLFDKPEVTRSVRWADVKYPPDYDVNPDDADLTTTAWYLTEVILPNGTSINFEYEEKSYYSKSIISYSQVTNEILDLEIAIPYTLTRSGRSVPPSEHYSSYSPNTGAIDEPVKYYGSESYMYKKLLLKEITWPLGKVIFTTSDREDIRPYADSKPQKLDRIDIIPEGSSNSVNSVVFNNNTYFNNDRLTNPYPYKNCRLKLESLTINDATYSFKYYEYLGTAQVVSLPSKNSNNKDFWGYFNAANNAASDLVPEYLLTRDEANLYGMTITGDEDALGYEFFNTEPVMFDENLSGADRSSSLEHTLLGTLKEITYPTGGTETYTYELNDYAVTETESGTESLLNEAAGGLRIKTISTENGTREFFYNRYSPELNTEVSTGELVNKPLYTSFVYSEQWNNGACVFTVYLRRNSNSYTDLYGSVSGNSVGYQQVKEVIIDNEGNETAIISEYKSEMEKAPMYDMPSIPVLSNGQLTGERYIANGYTVKEIDYHYTRKVSEKYLHFGYNSWIVPYYMPSEFWHLSEVVERTYASDNSSVAAVINKSYSYDNNHKQLKSKTISTSDREEYTRLTYPQDIIVQPPGVSIEYMRAICKQQYTYPSALYTAVRGCMSNSSPSVLCTNVDKTCTDIVFNTFHDILTAGTADVFNIQIKDLVSNGTDICNQDNSSIVINSLAKSEDDMVDECAYASYNSELSSIANSEAAEVIDSMIAYNMTGVPVETIVSVNGKIVDGTSTVFGLDDNKLVIPKEKYSTNRGSAYPEGEYTPIYIDEEGLFKRYYCFGPSPTIYFDRTDQYGNIQEYHKEYDHPVSVKWNDTHTKPIAVIKNSTHWSYAYENFEQDAYWLPHITRNDTMAKTGKYSGYIPGKGWSHEVTMVGSYVWTSNTDERKFKFSSYMYCTTDEGWLGLAYSTPTQSSRIAQWIPCTSTNEWTLVEGFGTIPDDATTVWVVISNENGQGAIYVDDVRMYPSDAAMTNYSYEPLKGLSAVIDERGIVTTYEYDAYGRLICTKDHMGNILKTYRYNYAH